MLPEAAKAIEIADKHLPGASPERRMALAKDITAAIDFHARQMLVAAMQEARERPSEEELAAFNRLAAAAQAGKISGADVQTLVNAAWAREPAPAGQS